MLPVEGIRNELLDILGRGNRLVLTAPTGSGKTTKVPPMLLHGLAPKGRIVVLQPRRLAARLLALRVSRETGSRLGALVGYQTRHESYCSAETKILFVTDGLFLRQFQSNPRLDGVAAVVLDEFHERRVAMDLILGLVRMLQEIRPDLKICVMSATLQASSLTQYLACPHLEVRARVHPVEIRYEGTGAPADPWDAASDAVVRLLRASNTGDVLVFMPGIYEIRRTLEACASRPACRDVDLLPLHGTLPHAQQDRAVAPSSRRKVIVATNVAETSITIEGVGSVVDSGLVRRGRHDPRRGIDILYTDRVCCSSADQRAGRAGRTSAGVCVRLWTRLEQERKPRSFEPELLRADLAEPLLLLLSLGIRKPDIFPWLDAPDVDALRQAQRLLESLGATDSLGALTTDGTSMSRLPLHPRLGRLLLEAARRACLPRACLWGAIVSEKDVFLPGRNDASPVRDGGPPLSDLVRVEAALDYAMQCGFQRKACADRGIDADACRQVIRTRDIHLSAAKRQGLDSSDTGNLESALKALLAAYPDRVAALRNSNLGLYERVGGQRCRLSPSSLAHGAELVLPLEVQERASGQGARLFASLASRIELDWIEQMFPDRLETFDHTQFNPVEQCVERAEGYLFDGLRVSTDETTRPDPIAAAALLAEQILSGRLTLREWNDPVDHWIARTRCVREWFPDKGLTAYGDDDLRTILAEVCAGATRFSQVRTRPVLPAVKAALSSGRHRFVEQMAPEAIRLPSGRKLKIRYEPGKRPVGRARIQDLYGLETTPAVAGGQHSVLLQILAPSYRPVQTTDDLAGFWANLYPRLKKELARRYPKHEWR